MYKLIAFIFVLIIFISFSQNKNEEYYKNQYYTSKNDSLKVLSLINWDELIYTSDSEKDLKLNNLIINLCLKNINVKRNSKISKLFYRYHYALSLNNIGLVAFEKNDMIKALSCFSKAYSIATKDKLFTLESNILNNMGLVYRDINSSQKALTYFLKSVKFKNKTINHGPTYNNIGLCYSELDIYDKAMYFFQKSINISLQKEDKLNLANSICNLGEIYRKQKNYLKAIQFLDSSSNVYKSIDYNTGIAYSLQRKGQCQFYLKMNDLALKSLLKSLEISKTFKLLKIHENSTFYLYKLYKSSKNVNKSLHYLEEYNLVKDMILKNNNEKILIQKQIEVELKQYKKLNDIKLKKEKEISNEKSLRQQIFILLILLVLLLISIFFFVLKKSFKEVNIKKNIIENQKLLVEKKQKEILDSIIYAKRIQKAILPPNHLFQTYFKESFVFYKPKDIVAGDFYWLEMIEDTVLVAAADCTGHGVPGAMVSVVCNNGLNRAVREFGLTKPNEILDKTRELVLEEFKKSEEEVKDGMDISLCSLNRKTYQLQWSGANNPLWIIRNDEIIEFKPDKQPIGKHDEVKPFTNHLIQLQKNDCLYFFTDGFQDQFGGPKEKKFRTSKMKELFISINHLPLNEQKDKILTTFDSWKDKLEQVDDVCIIGIRC
ncbi:MAG: tetratricopeptide repeat protein [Flavobacteriia bacterium]|nr:tetratricopeptide repeat protein [Flavobacteriia bacterium]